MSSSMLVYAYVRMSSAGQVDGDSERRQLADARGWAERNGHVFVDKALKDLGVSAFRGSNQREGAALGAFLKGLKDGKLEPGILYLEAVDRLSREPPMRILNLITDILATGTSIMVRQMGWQVTEDNFQSTLFPQLSLMAALAHNESRQKSERITAAHRARQDRARLGLKSKGAYNPPWLQRIYEPGGVVEYVEILEVVASIRRAFELASTGMGALSIARTLNVENAPVVAATNARGERRWYQSYVGKLLKDRRLLGEYQPSRVDGDRLIPFGDPIPNYFPRVISGELWDAAQAAGDPKLGRKVGTRKGAFANLFTGGMAKCGCCGGSMLMRATYKKGLTAQTPYLRCANAQQGLKCENTRYSRLDWFETKVLDALPGIPWRDLIRDRPVEEAESKANQHIDQLWAEIQNLTRNCGRLLKVIESMDDPGDQILDRFRELQADIAALKKSREQLIRDRDSLRRNAAQDEAAVDDAAELIRLMQDAAPTELYRVRQKLHQILRRIISGIEFQDGVARVHIRGLMLHVPLDKTSPVNSGFEMGRFGEFWKQGDHPLIPNEAGTKLVKRVA